MKIHSQCTFCGETNEKVENGVPLLNPEMDLAAKGEQASLSVSS